MYNPLTLTLVICVLYQIVEFPFSLFMCGLCNLLTSGVFLPSGLRLVG